MSVSLCGNKTCSFLIMVRAIVECRTSMLIILLVAIHFQLSYILISNYYPSFKSDHTLLKINHAPLGLVALPPYLYFYTYGASEERVPYHLCYIYDVFCDYLPTLFHTASIWLTVALAAQVTRSRGTYQTQHVVCLSYS